MTKPMKHSKAIRASLFAAIGAGLVGGVVTTRAAHAADFPPPPPTTYYGTAAGATVGQKVIGIVIDGDQSTTCGEGQVLSDGQNAVYVVDVVSDTQKTGCGRSGRQVVFYLPGTGTNPGRMSSNTASWQDPGLRAFNITLGKQLARRSVNPAVARDGLN